MPHSDNDEPPLCKTHLAQRGLSYAAALRRSRQAAIPRQKRNTFLTITTPQALARGVTAQLVQKPRRVSPPQRRKKVKSFSQATCAAEKILLRLQVWNLCAVGAQIMRAADCSPFVKKEYFLTATTPQAIACGVTAQLVKNLVEFRRRSGERKSNHFLRRHVRLRKYFSGCKCGICVP